MSYLQKPPIPSDHPEDNQSDPIVLSEEKQVNRFIGKDNAKNFLILTTSALFLFSLLFFIPVCVAVIPSYNKSINGNFTGKYLMDYVSLNNNKLGNWYTILSLFVLLFSLTIVTTFPPAGRKQFSYLFFLLILVSVTYLNWIYLYNQTMDIVVKKTYWHAFTIFWTGLLYACSLIVSVYPKQGGKLFRLFFVFLIFGFGVIITWLLLAHKIHFFNIDTKHLLTTLWAYLIFFNSSFSCLIAAIAMKRKPSIEIGFSVGIVLTVFELLFLRYFSMDTSPNSGIVMLIILLQGLAVTFLFTDMGFMVSHRYDFYLTNDWFLGFVHLLTDVFFQFWYNLFVERKSEEMRAVRIVNELNKQLDPTQDSIEIGSNIKKTDKINIAIVVKYEEGSE